MLCRSPRQSKSCLAGSKKAVKQDLAIWLPVKGQRPMGKILRHLLEALRSTAVMWSNFGTGAKDVAADLIRLKTKVNERRYLDTFYIWVTLMTHWGGEVEQVCVSHTSAPEIAANPTIPPPHHAFAHPDPTLFNL